MFTVMRETIFAKVLRDENSKYALVKPYSIAQLVRDNCSPMVDRWKGKKHRISPLEKDGSQSIIDRRYCRICSTPKASQPTNGGCEREREIAPSRTRQRKHISHRIGHFPFEISELIQWRNGERYSDIPPRIKERPRSLLIVKFQQQRQQQK